MKNHKSIGALALISFLSALYLWTENDDLSSGRALHQNNDSSSMEKRPPPSLRKLEAVDDSVPATTDSSDNNMCLISSYGVDGIGHQMEAKLSCIAAAGVLDNVVYAHHPVDKLQHGADPESLESFFGLQDALSKLGPSMATLYDESTMRKEQRSPLPWIGKCHQSSWFDEKIRLPACEGAQEEAALGDNDNKLAVFTADNCWDFFYCELEQDPTKIKHLWYSHVAPVLSEALHLSPVFRRLRAAAVEQHQQRRLMFGLFKNKQPPTNLKIVAHVRRGDAGNRKMPGSYYRELLHKLIDASLKNNNMIVDIAVHTDGHTEDVAKEIGLDDIIETANNNDNNVVINLEVFGRDNKSITVEKACFDMVHSDIFIASKSAFSVTCGLYRNKHPSTNISPKVPDRYGLTSLGWSMLNNVGSENVLLYDNSDGKKVWNSVGEDFFNGLIDRAITTTTTATEDIMDDIVA